MIGGFQVGWAQPLPAFQQVTLTPESTSGGWFTSAYEREMVRRQRERRRLRELEDETEDIEDNLDRAIAQELRKQEAEDERRAELARLTALASKLGAEQARREYGERVAEALTRAVDKGNYSAMEALEREISRANDEMQFLLFASALILTDD